MKKLAYPLFFQLVFSGSISGQDNIQFLQADSIIHLSAKPDLKDNNKILLEWSSISPENGGFYMVERSNDGKNFEVIGVIKAPSLAKCLRFRDEKPLKTKNFYRVKVERYDGRIIYSKIINAGQGGGISWRFYPNPVDKILIVRTDFSLELQITDAIGITRIRQQLLPGMQLVNVSMLEKGIYILIIKEKDTNKIVVEKLVKN